MGPFFYLREFVDVEIDQDRMMYAYQFIDPLKKFVFRYDNTGHHKKLHLPTYPHHKHNGLESRVISSMAPKLADVLKEIETLIQLP